VAEDLLTTKLYRYGSRRTLFVPGELDVATAHILEGAVDGALDGHGGEFCLDLSGLTFIDSRRAKHLA
jgi:anti-anti-sigma regulatory factor